MSHKEVISLARLTNEANAKTAAKLLAGKSPKGDLQTWTSEFAVSGAKPGGKNPPPGAPVQ